MSWWGSVSVSGEEGVADGRRKQMARSWWVA
jgi:hypothetical protein